MKGLCYFTDSIVIALNLRVVTDSKVATSFSIKPMILCIKMAHTHIGLATHTYLWLHDSNWSNFRWGPHAYLFCKNSD